MYDPVPDLTKCLDATSVDLTRIARCLLKAAIESPPQWRVHPLGFYLWEIGTAGESAIRLHYWDPTDLHPVAKGPYHDHVWHLESVVVAGAIVNREYYPVLDPLGTLVMGTIEQLGQVDVVRYSEEMYSLVETATAEVRTGDRYSIPPGVVHSSSLPSSSAPTVTLVRSTRALSRGPLTFAAIGATSHSPERQVADSAQIESATSGLMTILRALQ